MEAAMMFAEDWRSSFRKKSIFSINIADWAPRHQHERFQDLVLARLPVPQACEWGSLAVVREWMPANTPERATEPVVAGLIEKDGLLVWASPCPAEDIDWESIEELEREARDESFDFVPDGAVRY